MTEQILGRDEAEYPDDVRCPTCCKFFRRNELKPLSKEEILLLTDWPYRVACGYCPICQIKLYH